MCTVLNADANHAIILATYADFALRGKRGKDSLSDSQIEDAVAGVVKLLRFFCVSPGCTTRAISERW